jgi:nicotinamidase-related amidase
MAEVAYPKGRTALLFVDPYNDFYDERGRFWGKLSETKAGAGLRERLKTMADAARAAGLKVFIVPHHRFGPGDLDGWAWPNPYQQRGANALAFERGAFGGEWYAPFAPQPGDVIVQEHWGSSGFASTDLDMLLKQHGITHLILIGLLANTCIEATGRFASELGYHVTLVTDATAAYTDEAMHAAHAINGPTYAHAVLPSARVIAALKG